MLNKDDNKNKNNDINENSAKKITSEVLNSVKDNPSLIKANGCAACHVLFSIVDKAQVNESEASDLLSQILYNDPQLNDSFIEMVEEVHMKQRMMGVPFSIRTRESKDKYLDSNLRNVLSELSTDLVNYGTDIVLKITHNFDFIRNCTKYWDRFSCCNRGTLLLHAKKGSRYSYKNFGVY
jgi:hypothetical protein